jgi:glycosyltransferase involved in cell wall biosynthesis
MRVLILYSDIFPGATASSYRILNYAKGLNENGIVVSILATEPNQYDLNTKCKIIDSIPYDHILKKPLKRHILINRISLILLNIVTSFRCLSLRNKNNIVILYGFAWYAKLLIVVSFGFSKTKVVLEVNENPYSMENGRLTVFNVFFKMYRWLTLNFVFPLMDGFIVISESLSELVNHHKSKRAITIKIPIIVNPDISNIDTSRCIIEDPFILHTGSIGERKDGLLAVIEAIGIAVNHGYQKLKFVITGKRIYIPQYKELKALIKVYNIENNIIYTGELVNEELASYRLACKMAIVNKPVNEQNLYNFSTKLGEYLACSIPVIASNTGEMSFFLKDGINSFVVEPNNSKAISDKITYILNHPTQAREIGIEGRKLAEDIFNYKVHGKRLAGFLQELLK